MALDLMRWLQGDTSKGLKLLQYSIGSRQIVSGFLQVVIGIYFALIGFDPVTIGFLMSIPLAVGALRSIMFGLLSDRYGRKPFLVFGGVFSTIRLIVYALYTDFWILVLAQAMEGLGEGGGAGQPVVSGFISDRTNADDRIRIFNRLAFTNAIAAILGSLMAGLPAYFKFTFGSSIIQAHALLFWIGAAFSGVSVILTLFLKDRKQVKRIQKRGFLAIESWPTIGKFSLVRSISGLSFGLIVSLLPLYFYLRFGAESEALGPLYALSRFLSLVSYLIAPKVVARLGDVRSIIATRIVACSIALMFPLTSMYHGAAILLVAFRTVIMFGMPLRQSFATGIVDPSETASTIGISNFIRMLARTIAPTLTGYMFATASLSSPFIMGAALLSANALLYRIFFYQQKKNRFARQHST